MRRLISWGTIWLASGVFLSTATEVAAQLPGVVVRFENYAGTATVAVHSVAKHKLRLDIDPRTETNGLVIRVELPATGRGMWPVADVEIRDSRGEALVVRRSGIEWEKLLIPVPALRASYFVQAIDSPMDNPRLTTEKERQLTDSRTGLSVSVAHWYDGRRAALSMRFDDSHPTHLTTVVPTLREYGFRGTFMINPGLDEPGSRRRSSFQLHRAEWEAVAKSGDHEFANHSAHHRGATSDDDMEMEIGDAARSIWRMTPDKSKLTALNLGGGTQWATSRTLRYYLDKYHHFDASGGSLGMDDTYGHRVTAFREHLERHIERRGWCRAHFHSIGESLSSSEANFRAALDIAQEHKASLWIAGMADVYKYQTERNASLLSLIESNDRRLRLRLSCQTDPELYDQAVTIEVAVPKPWPSNRIGVKDSLGEVIANRRTKISGQTILRFEVAPRVGDYIIEWSP